MKKSHRKLSLRAEHIRTLTNRDLIELIGGLKITDGTNASHCLEICNTATQVAQCNEPTFGTCA